MVNNPCKAPFIRGKHVLGRGKVTFQAESTSARIYARKMLNVKAVYYENITSRFKLFNSLFLSVYLVFFFERKKKEKKRRAIEYRSIANLDCNLLTS